MNTIVNKLVPNRKVEIELIRDDFTSPILGNIWVGRKVTLNISTATNFVKNGYAKFTETDSKEPDDAAAKKKAADDEAEAKKKAEADAANTGKEGDAGAGGGEKKPTLEEALKRLDPKDETHWTKGGKPNLTVLTELTGSVVKRADVDDVAPDFTRDVAAGE